MATKTKTGRKRGRKPSLLTVTDKGDYKAELEALLRILAKSIENCKGYGMASLTREYRETAKEYHELTGEDPSDDLLSRFASGGKAGTDDLGTA